MNQTKGQSQVNIVAVIDGMENKWGNDFMGYDVKSPLFLASNDYDIVIASVNFYGEIFNNIVNKGISKERIIPNFML